MKERRKFYWSFEKKLYIALLPVIPIVVIFSMFYDNLVALMTRYRPVCAILYYFHIYCPGCGGTRAIGALIHGHPIQSFLYHPVVIILVLMYLIFMISHTISFIYPKYDGIEIKTWHSVFIIAIIVINFIVRNILLHYGLPTYL